jgi:hypothetical protein
VRKEDIEAVDNAAQANGACQMVLVRLRQSLVGGDQAGIERGEKELSNMEEQLQTSFAPRIKVSNKAMNAAEKIAGDFSGRQIAAFVAQHSEEIPDPVDLLQAGLTQCRGMKADEFRQFSADLSEQIAELDCGFAQRPRHDYAQRVTLLLRMAYSLDASDFEQSRADLQDKARDAAKADSATVVRHWVEWELALLLANPQLTVALSDRSSWADPTATNLQVAR